jgi:hypothetical protein
MPTIRYTLLNENRLRVGKTTLSPWPEFSVSGGDSELPILLHELLLSDDPFVMLWRAKIPDPLLSALLSFPAESLPELLYVSQLDPQKFVDWATWCPALLIASSPFRNNPEASTWDFIDIFHAFQDGWRAALEIAGIEPTRSNLRILQKIPAHAATGININTVAKVLHDRKKLKLMRHLSLIDDDIIERLTLPGDILDFGLLALDTQHPFHAEYETLNELYEGICYLRRQLKLYPIWPYKGVNVSYKRLNYIHQKLALRLSLGSDAAALHLGIPPIAPITTSKFSLQALTTVGELMNESKVMSNCIQTFAGCILGRTHYAYKLLFPERATILINRKKDFWKLQEARTINNGHISADSMLKLKIWLDQNDDEETQNDYPF